jgi:hypothetical protein
MKEITLRIPDNKFRFFMELLESLGFVKTTGSDSDTFIISERQKELVNIEIDKIAADPHYLLNWEDAKLQLKAD